MGDEIELVNNTANLQYIRPFDRGYLTNWDSEHQVWNRAFGENKLKVGRLSFWVCVSICVALHDCVCVSAASPTSHSQPPATHIYTHKQVVPAETRLLLTEAPFTPTSLSSFSTQVIFEEFGFAACAKLPAPILSAYNYSRSASTTSTNTGDCVLVVDSGFSFTHVVPIYKSKAQREAVRRINVGGKLLTNFLKETVSYRQWNMMDEFQLMNDAKEALCYVSQDFAAEMAKLRPGGGPNRRLRANEQIRRNFVLPDFQTTMKGYVQDPQDQQHQQQQQQQQQDSGAASEQQVLAMEVERFVVPEVLFRPSDVGLRQAGLPEVIVEAVEACDVGLRAGLYSNIVLTGGNTLFPGLAERLEKELRALVPHYYPIHIQRPENPLEYAWVGGSRMAREQDHQLFVTKAQYEEYGAEACQEQMFASRW